MSDRTLPAERKWWLEPTQEELGIVQFALRMVAKHPWLSDEEKGEALALADSLWEGYFCQPDPHYEDGDP